jgi:addiction module HigA family antidote
MNPSSNKTQEESAMSTYRDPLTIGEFMGPLNISAYRLAQDIRVPVSRIQEILKDERAISLDTGLRLSHYFGMNELFFIELQAKVTFEKERIRVLREIADLPTYKELQQKRPPVGGLLDRQGCEL